MNPVELPPALAEALAGFVVHLRDERGRGPHTVRAHSWDVADPLGSAASTQWRHPPNWFW